MSDVENNFLDAEISVEDAAFGSAHPVLQWLNGDVKNAKVGGIAHTGGFFLSDDQGVEPPPGFKPYTMITSEGDEVQGFASLGLTGSVIRYRRCWMAEPEGDEKGLSQRYGWNEYDEASAYGKVRGSCHVLFAMEGYEEPVLLAFRGMVAKRILGQGQGARGIIPKFGQKVIGTAKRLARKSGKNRSYPLCAFKMTIKPETGTDNKTPVFTKVGSGSNTSMVTYPVWDDEPDQRVDSAILSRLYVGNELFATYQDWHNEANDWVSAWDAEVLAIRAKRSTAADAPALLAAEGSAGGAPGEQNVPF